MTPNSIGPGRSVSTKRLRVLHVVPAAEDGTEMPFVERQVESLMVAGIECRVVPFAGSAMLTRPRRLLDAFRLIRLTAGEFDPDIVHAHWGSLLALTSIAATRRPTVITYRGSDLNPTPSENGLLQHVRVVSSQLAAFRAAAIVCVSEPLRDRLWWRRDRVRVSPDGVDTGRFTVMPRDHARRYLNWDPDEPVVLFNAGRSPDVKRLDLAEAAVSVARDRAGAFRFVVVRGDVPYEEMPIYMNAADCLLLTSDYEGSPNVIREALACDLPIVTVRAGDVERWLSGVTESWVTDRDPVAIGRAIAAALTPPRRSDGSRRSPEFSEAASRDTLLSLYRELAEVG